MKKILGFLVAATLILPLFAQSEELPEENSIQYELTEIIYKIDGMTTPRLLEKNLGYPRGQRFNSIEETAEYVENIRQQLINFEYFANIIVFYEINSSKATASDGTTAPGTQAPGAQDSVHQDSGVAAPGEPHIIPVTVTVSVKNELSLMLMPGPKYNSNSGLSIKLKYKDNNFLGSMESVYTNLEFNQNYDDEEKTSTPEFVIDMSFAYPFTINNRNFTATFDSDIGFQNINTPDYLFRLKADIGIENELITGRTFTLAAGFTQGISLNAQDDKFRVYEDDELYFTEKLYTKATFLLADFGKWGKLNYAPQLSFLYNWDKNGINPENTDLSSPKLAFSHGLNFGQINRVGMFRKGIAAEVSSSYSYDISRTTQSLSFTGLATGYYTLFSHLGVNSRLGFFEYLETTPGSGVFIADGDENRGGDIRGIRNHRIKTDLGIYFSLDFPIHVFTFNARKIAATYFPESKFMNSVFGALGFDFILVPFFDMMLTHYNSSYYPDPQSVPEGDRYFSFKDGWYAGGLDFIIVPHTFKSQYVRIGVGWDLAEVLKQKSLTANATRDGESIYEITIGLSLEY